MGNYSQRLVIWDLDNRSYRLAKLDALLFHLYGPDRKETACIVDQFPIVREEDEQQFDRYLTRDLTLTYMNAVAAGDLNATIRFY